MQFRDGFIVPGGFYVAITRVRNGQGLFLRDFDKSYVKVADEVNNKIAEMRKDRPYSFFKLNLSSKCFKHDANDFKVGYLNIRGLTDSFHSEYLNADKNLLNLELLCISDSRLTKRNDILQLHSILTNWTILHRFDCSDGGRHMGLLVLTPTVNIGQPKLQGIEFQNLQEIKDDSGKTHVQVLNASQSNEIYSFIYCRITPSLKQTKMIRNLTLNSHFILGDMNLNPEKPDDLQKLEVICGEDKMMHLRAITTTNRNQLDHIIVKKAMKGNLVTDSFLNFTSDHKSLVLRKSRTPDDEPISLPQDIRKEVKIEPKTESCSDSSKSITQSNYSSLNGTKWLKDDVIDKFSELLMKRHEDVFIFSTFFTQSFFTHRKDYAYVKRFDKSPNLFECRLVMIPLLQHSHWFLCVMNLKDAKLSILDPYIKDNTKENIEKRHLEELSKIESEFLKVHFETKTSNSWRELVKSVLLPPSIPEQKDGHNCGLYLLEFSR